jgi:hypothetical protein
MKGIGYGGQERQQQPKQLTIGYKPSHHEVERNPRV